jgi:glucose-6-phosphate dehydrogenase assembly protein OpcA
VAAAAHPCRLLVVTRSPAHSAPDRLDAEIVVGGRLGPCEAVIMRMQGRLALHAESVVMPLLAPDVPVVTWWHGPPPEQISADPLGVVAERRITDCAQTADPVATLRQRAADYAAGDTDLAWTRLTGWRTLVAGALDTAVQDEPRAVRAAAVTAPATDASGALLAGWLAARLGITPTRTDPQAGGLESVHLFLDGDDEITITGNLGTALLRRTGRDERAMPLLRRTLGEELAEELRRLDADQTYAAALSAATGAAGLTQRPSTRVHTWVDPAGANATAVDAAAGVT